MPRQPSGGGDGRGGMSISTMGEVGPLSNGNGSKFTGRSSGFARPGRRGATDGPPWPDLKAPLRRGLAGVASPDVMCPRRRTGDGLGADRHRFPPKDDGEDVVPVGVGG
jgi:hypothetical protein